MRCASDSVTQTPDPTKELSLRTLAQTQVLGFGCDQNSYDPVVLVRNGSTSTHIPMSKFWAWMKNLPQNSCDYDHDSENLLPTICRQRSGVYTCDLEEWKRQSLGIFAQSDISRTNNSSLVSRHNSHRLSRSLRTVELASTRSRDSEILPCFTRVPSKTFHSHDESKCRAPLQRSRSRGILRMINTVARRIGCCLTESR
eukprot:gb/GEZJ01004023.1/.p1 GENE.gb/GEZJ01004023.1/~~gb/GEZJ01004023.1/.p1  ORF type:complete len:199 (-),score=5.34 gb/GEZJ01004023.1/:1659-2255(-)